ncbi:hypothetical protein [Sulfurovum sp.]|uniref:hypothetical protein n=1 Tax=Sulfurovum sp. TaxID=1969726 RepID=UPI003561D2B9
MKKIFVISVLILLMISGCSQESDSKPGLDCVLSGVVNGKTGKLVEFDRQDAIKSGFEYRFRFKRDKTVTVDSTDVNKGADVYVQDDNIIRSYSLQRETKVDTDMKFQFSESFDDVEFLIVSEETKYLFDCSQAK